jgi:hypothetical protein
MLPHPAHPVNAAHPAPMIDRHDLHHPEGMVSPGPAARAEAKRSPTADGPAFTLVVWTYGERRSRISNFAWSNTRQVWHGTRQRPRHSLMYRFLRIAFFRLAQVFLRFDHTLPTSYYVIW